MWTERIEQNGLSVLLVDSRHVRIGRGDQSTVYRVVQSSRRLNPRDIDVPGPGEDSLLVASILSPAAAEEARRNGWSVITDSGPAWIHTDRGTIEFPPNDPAAPPPSVTRRIGHSTFNVARVFLERETDHPVTQSELSKRTQLSQPRISQILRRLGDEQIVVRRAGGWIAADRATAIDWWTKNYPGPGGLRTHWFGLDTAVRQARSAYDLLAAADGRPLVSGDVAADIIAPWRAPLRSLLYSRFGADFTDIGLTAVGPDEATLTVILPEDHGMWPDTDHRSSRDVEGRQMECASPLQVLYDLEHGLGSDAEEAADVWRQRMLKQAGER